MAQSPVRPSTAGSKSAPGAAGPGGRGSRGSRSDRSGRTALLGCGLAIMLLVGIVAVGLLGYAGGIFAVRSTDGYQQAVDALASREALDPVLGTPVTDGWWLGLQLARGAGGAQELRVQSVVRGPDADGMLYTTLQDGPDGWTPTTVLLDVDGEITDILLDLADAHDAETDDRRATLLADAHERIARGDFAGALPLAEEALVLDPDNVDAWATRAELRLGLGQVRGAEADAREALVLNVDNGPAQIVLAQVHRLDEDWDACIEVATIRLRAAPRDGAAWTVRAHCYLGAQRPREALAGAREGCNRGHPEGCTLARSLE